MGRSVAQLLASLENDPLRGKQPFSAALLEAQEKMFTAAKSKNKDDIANTLGEWLQHNQPCLFGRVAAKLDLIEYCILFEEDLEKTDQEIMNQIQRSRQNWTREGYAGRKSAFIIIAVSEKIARALPNNAMKDLTKRLCFLYLREEIEVDRIYVDELFLEIPNNRKTTWKWPTGVNYFSAQGDGRWWQDHRIPGGMAFSVNSIGHMVKAGRLAKGMKEVLKLVDSPEEGWTPSLVDSLEKSLDLAMRTIAGASDAASGKATFLLPLSTEEKKTLPQCPIQLPKQVSGMNHCEYAGFYHTDYTIPSEYFIPDVTRPVGTIEHRLDFTYLFVQDVDNPDHDQMGTGMQVRSSITGGDYKIISKTLRGAPQEVAIEENPRLLEATKGRFDHN
jgi:hypothetical protein